MTKSTGKRPYQPQRPDETLAELMERRLPRGGPDECWEWQGARLRAGYGNFALRKKWYKAHRVAYELAHGPVPDGMWVLHRCDNPPCCNPAHLRLGTPKDNSADMVEKGRATTHLATLARGTKNFNAKLTPDAVRAIKSCDEPGVVLAERYGVSPSAISAIRVGRTWGHVA